MKYLVDIVLWHGADVPVESERLVQSRRRTTSYVPVRVAQVDH